jgi:hypothetical protein
MSGPYRTRFGPAQWQDVAVADQTTVIRPSAILADRDARRVLDALEARDVSKGGVWSASPGLWQRYDRPWDGPGGMRGNAQLVGTIGTVYGTPSKYDITIYRVTVTMFGAEHSWTVERICDDALQYADLTLESCPRTSLNAAAPDPFRKG